MSGLLLSYRCTIRRVSSGSDIPDLDCDDVTATKLAVNRQIKHGKVAKATPDLELRPNRPDMFGSQRWLCPGQLALVPRPAADPSHYRIFEIFHGSTPSLRSGAIIRSVSKCSTPEISKLNDTLHAILKETIPSGLFQL